MFYSRHTLLLDLPIGPQSPRKFRCHSNLAPCIIFLASWWWKPSEHGRVLIHFSCHSFPSLVSLKLPFGDSRRHGKHAPPTAACSTAALRNTSSDPTSIQQFVVLPPRTGAAATTQRGENPTYSEKWNIAPNVLVLPPTSLRWWSSHSHQRDEKYKREQSTVQFRHGHVAGERKPEYQGSAKEAVARVRLDRRGSIPCAVGAGFSILFPRGPHTGHGSDRSVGACHRGHGEGVGQSAFLDGRGSERRD